MIKDWHEKLLEYFPAREMKSKKHFESLFTEKEKVYKKEEGPEYVLVYLEQQDFIFIDYILVSGSRRSRGTGSRLLDRLKQKNKAIILEVEPENASDPDSLKRIDFYQRNGFKEMGSIQYERIHAVTGELNKMDIYSWAPSPRTDEWVFERMKYVYQEIHAFNSKKLYGKNPQPADDVLQLRKKSFSKAK
ncbi:GNAT family N-acetyltransferase [Mesobacillus jeotgali]|uniref:GNAT family N-acetyltransferase n=1 Tax=Mesobacillus jeotgali TaxID=129985 RepID=UPI0009A7C255|nr:GNAT family N-acetyltransferase [Mesobacillus jeotgali]